ncbi:lecithin retinol acyltransferase family protein [Alteromonas ponticola]|uniref:Lecithin retinol acyltransferase family protein n=1 Tax=Alteromonas aquimaris TaxID=2998417 RepID=A0ABT3P7F2_9ALTE|nr:lecithin retinol acyltransferase family protein [Alteromonas aquimaris]MCW8108687.1 lecithin retinol acyltransferase family protein [Alteromonas aquimaris]
MPIPLIWLGAGLVAAAAGVEYAREQQKASGDVRVFPGECKGEVEPVDGAIVCCGIYGVFQHTGIWLDGKIVELAGTGLIRAISPARFLANRSGEKIFVACDKKLNALTSPDIIRRTAQTIFQYSKYDVVENNCNRYVNRCMTGTNPAITRFAQLNASISRHYSTPVNWQLACF